MRDKVVIGIFGFFVRLQGYLFDRIHGVETETYLSLGALGLSDERSFNYGPMQIWLFRRIMKRIGVGPQDVFIDMGSGKGRALMLAGAFPFRRIIGVELSGDLAGLCRENLSRMRFKRGNADFIVESTDAAVYPIPDDATVICFYNPFPLVVLNDVIGNIKSSVRRRPRTVTLVYINPVYEAEMENKHGLKGELLLNLSVLGVFLARCVCYRIERE